MGTDTAFEQEFQRFLEHRGFPTDLTAAQILQRTDTMVSTLTAKVCSQIGFKLKFTDLIEQGGGGLGGPHRLDLLVKYSMDAAPKEYQAAIKNSGTHA